MLYSFSSYHYIYYLPIDLHCIIFLLHTYQLRQNACYAVIMLLPLISRVILQTFRCAEYDDDDDYSEPRKVLFVDSNVDCNSRTYMIMKFYAAVNVVIWPVGIPLGLMLWLGALAKYLDPPGMTEAQAIAEREIDTRVKRSAIAFMALYYRPRYW